MLNKGQETPKIDKDGDDNMGIALSPERKVPRYFNNKL